MSSKEITLITTALSKFTKEKKNLVYLGVWCHPEEWNNFNSLKKKQIIKYHWNEFNKRLKDDRHLKKIYEQTLIRLSSKLNKSHNVKKNLRYWRIIIGPWLAFYIDCMFDRWENLRIFFKKYHNIKKKTYYFDCGDDIFYNSNTEDFHNKTKGDDFWNHKNYIRIIKFKYLDKITLKEQKYTKYSNIQKSKKSYKLRNILSIRNVLKQLFNGLDFAFSYFAIRINKIILDTFYFSKLNQLKIFFRLRLIPSFYHYTFKDVSFGLKKKLDFNIRERIFKKEKNFKDPFINYLYFAMKTDFPIVFLEKFNYMQKLNSGLNKLKKKLIITKVSHVCNERFKMWAAEMTTKHAKFHIACHGGFLPFKLHSTFSHEKNIADKYLTWHQTKEKKLIKLSPVQLLKNKNISVNKQSGLILNWSTHRHAGSLLYLPYAAQYNICFKNLCETIENLNPKIKEKLIYRTGSEEFGLQTTKQFSKKFKKIKVQESIGGPRLVEEMKNSKLIICNHPSTTICEAIIADIPTVLVFPEQLFMLTKDSKKILSDLQKNKIYFKNPSEASKHINKIWNNPEIWWQSPSTRKSLEKLRKFAFDIKDNWLDEWTNHIKKYAR